MSKKKKSKRKLHQRSTTGGTVAATPSVVTEAPLATSAAASVESGKADPVQSQPVDPRWGYVGRDVKRVAILASICIIIELALWYLFEHTGLGPAVYNLISL